MSHARTQIRETVALALTGLPTTGAHVFVSPVYALQETDLPALRIFNGSESISPSTIHGPAILERTLQLRIEAVVRELADLDGTLDQIVQEVETAISGIAFDGVSIHLTSIDAPELSGEANQPTGQTTMTFEATYFTLEDAPDVALSS